MGLFWGDSMIGARWLLAAGAAVALAGQVDEPIVRITVNLVQVDAVVTDSKGQQVTDGCATQK
jgi:hypothetical protein